MKLLKISAVSYLNTFPFVYGIRESGFLQNFSLELDVPSICAEKLKNGAVDVALVPVGALHEIHEPNLISGFCIGAVREVKTVLLLSRVPVEKIRRVYLDFDSRTSVALVKVLADYHWHIDPEWVSLKPGQSDSGNNFESLVAIGDKTFELQTGFPYVYDLAETWINFSGLPFVFAVWVSREKLPDDIQIQFSQALAYGISHKRECLEYFRDTLPACTDCLSYLERNISFELDEKKMEGLLKFLTFINRDPNHYVRF